MNKLAIQQRRAGFAAFFISGICAISSGVVVSLLQEEMGFAYGTTGTLLAMMNIGNLAAGFAVAFLSGSLGMKKSVALLTAGYMIGYGAMAVFSPVVLLMAAFFLVGIGKGSTINTCTILISDNSKDRTRGMNLMHSCYALGALLCPFVISAASVFAPRLSIAALAVCGGLLWLTFLRTPMGSSRDKKGKGTDWSFLRSGKFWLLTALIFCQNGTETSVSGWMVTYFKGSGILTGTLSAYTVTVMWSATLATRMLFAFVFPIKRAERAMTIMSAGCLVFYFGLVQADSQWPAILLLFAFAAFMAGLNPTAVACAGRMTSVASMGIMLPVASSGAILMPWITGLVADAAGIRAGMYCNIGTCLGLLLLSAAAWRLWGRGELRD